MTLYLYSAGFLVAVVALAFSTLEKTEVWPNRSRLLATFRAPSLFVQKVHFVTLQHNIEYDPYIAHLL